MLAIITTNNNPTDKPTPRPTEGISVPASLAAARAFAKLMIAYDLRASGKLEKFLAHLDQNRAHELRGIAENLQEIQSGSWTKNKNKN